MYAIRSYYGFIYNILKKILIIRFSSIGDIIQCMAVTRGIKDTWPGAQLSWITRTDMAPMLKADPYIDKIYLFDRKLGLTGLVKMAVSMRQANFVITSYSIHYTKLYETNSNFKQFDCSKLDQWEVVFSHAASKGMYLHFKMQETENERLLDDGNTGVERKLYYRELIARFGHHLALNWNLGEECGANFNIGKKPLQNDAQRIAMAEYMGTHDPYKGHVVLHTAPGDQTRIYTPLLGNKSMLTGISIQTPYLNVHSETINWIKNSKNAEKIWVRNNFV